MKVFICVYMSQSEQGHAVVAYHTTTPLLHAFVWLNKSPSTPFRSIWKRGWCVSVPNVDTAGICCATEGCAKVKSVTHKKKKGHWALGLKLRASARFNLPQPASCTHKHGDKGACISHLRTPDTSSAGRGAKKCWTESWSQDARGQSYVGGAFYSHKNKTRQPQAKRSHYKS